RRTICSAVSGVRWRRGEPASSAGSCLGLSLFRSPSGSRGWRERLLLRRAARSRGGGHSSGYWAHARADESALRLAVSRRFSDDHPRRIRPMSYDPASLAGVPEHGRERMDALKRGLFTSDLSVDEFLLVKAAGFKPLGFVVGSS